MSRSVVNGQRFRPSQMFSDYVTMDKQNVSADSETPRYHWVVSDDNRFSAALLTFVFAGTIPLRIPRIL